MQNTPKTIEQRCEVILENLEDKKIFVNGLDGYSEYNIRANKKEVIINALSEQDRISRESEREKIINMFNGELAYELSKKLQTNKE